MRWKTVALLGVACGVLVVILLLDHPTDSEKPLLSMPVGPITDLVTMRDGDTLVARYRASSWQVVSPVTDRADSAAVVAVLDGLARLVATRSYPAEGSLAPFGLMPPALALSARGSKEHEVKVAFGGLTPTGSDRYVHLDDDAVIHLVPQRLCQPIEAAVNDVRSRRLLPMPPETVGSIVNTTDGAELVMLRQPEGWHLRSPVVGRADDAAVDRLLRRLQEPLIRAFLPEASFPPTAAVWVLGGSFPAETLIVHRPCPESLLIRSSVRTDPCVVDTSIATLLAAPLSRWRMQALLPWLAYDTCALRLIRGSDTLSLTKEGNGPWRVGGDEANAARVMSLVRRLESCRVDSFLAEQPTGAWSASLTIEARSSFGDSMSLRVGEQHGSARVVVADHLGSPALMRCIDPDTISTDARAWRSRHLLLFNPYEAEAITVHLGAYSASARREGFRGWNTTGSWATVSSPDSVLAALGSARIERFCEETVLAETPRVVVSLELTLPERTVEVTLGVVGADSAFVSVSGEPWTGVSPNLIPLIRKSLGGEGRRNPT